MKAMVIALIGAAGITAVDKAVPWVRFGSAHEASAASHVRTQDRGRWTWRGAVAQGKTLEIRGLNGAVMAQRASGSEVEVTAYKHGHRSNPADVRIEVVEHGDGVTICAVYPGDHNACRPGGGRNNTHNSDVEVGFEVRVPAGVVFDGHTVNGSVEATGLTARVDLATVNGGVTLDTEAGDASGSTVNGSVNATVRGTGGGSLRFSAVNGGVTVSLPAGFGASFDASTVNGAISSDFPVTMTGRISPRRMRGQLGQGGRDLALRTVNGPIRLRSLP